MDYAKSQTQLRYTFSLVLVIAVLCQCSIKPLIAIQYYLNKQYIAANLCENKSNRAQRCEGKCYLKKRLKSATEKEQSIPDVVKQQVEWIVHRNTGKTSPTVFASSRELLFKPFLVGYNYAAVRSVFHPPCAAVFTRARLPTPLYQLPILMNET